MLLWPAARRPRRNMEPEAGVVLTLAADEEPQGGQEGAALAVNIDYDAPLPVQPFFAGGQCSSATAMVCAGLLLAVLALPLEHML